MTQHGLRILVLGLLAAVATLRLHAADALPGERTLESELKISGPAVYVRAPVGLRYRPGHLFPLQFRVHNPGAAFTGEVFVVEGAADDGLRSGDFSAVNFQTQSSRLVSVPVRAPAVTSNLTVVVRGSEAEGGVPVQRFRARLRDLKPLPTDARLILSIGRPGSDVRPGLDVVVPQRPAEMLDEPWMYDSVDLVVLRDDAFKAARPAAREALREYLLGGGRLLLTSQAGLQAAIDEKLIPIHGGLGKNGTREGEGLGSIGASLSWWQQHAGLKESDILARKNNRPVYCRLRHGLGQVVFLFPATDEITARDLGQSIFAHPALYRSREKHFDWRVQPERSSAFSYGQAQAVRVTSALLWMGIGALMFCVVLALALSSRSRLESVGLPLGLAALTAAMLAQWFPEPELVVTRIVWVQQAEDGRAAQWQEWKLIESFQQAREITALSPESGKLALLFDRAEDLAGAQGDLERVDGRLRIDHVWVQPSQPALLHAARVELTGALPPREFSSSDGASTLSVAGVLSEALQSRLAIVARSNGTLWYVEQLQDAGGFSLKAFDSPLSAVQQSLGLAGDKARARAAALGWATREALRSRRDTLICWGEGSEQSVKSLVELEPSNYEVASSFLISSSEIRIEEK